MNGQESLTDATMDEVYDVARKHVRKGSSREEIIAMLIAGGISQKAAESVVKNIVLMRSDSRGSGGPGMKNMMVGGLCCIAGTAVTFITYQMAANGGVYFVAWGAILFGGIQFFRGLTEYMAR